jgi:hypothetical protein
MGAGIVRCRRPFIGRSVLTTFERESRRVGLSALCGMVCCMLRKSEVV